MTDTLDADLNGERRATVSSERPPVTDWSTDFDHTRPEYAANAPAIWDDLRETCPVARTERFGGAWLPVRHDDVDAIARDPENFSSQGVIVFDGRPIEPAPMGSAPPITSDPPFHAFARRLLLPAFSPKAIGPWEEATRASCRELIDSIVDSGRDIADAAIDYAQHIPVRVISDMLGVPESDGDTFRHFIHGIIEDPGSLQDPDKPYEETFDYFLNQIVEDHIENPRDDLVGFLLDVEIEPGQKLAREHVTGTIALLLIAGIDTTWSAIGASLWHLAQHPQDRQRLLDEPELIDVALEEFLRFYAPVTMARIAAQDTEISGCPVSKGDWVLLPFPAANRDPEQFDQADEFVIDRARNRHSAFGLGIHRCLGSNLARMEVKVAIEEWLARVPHFELAPEGVNGEKMRWSAGQVRGPRVMPVKILETRERA